MHWYVLGLTCVQQTFVMRSNHVKEALVDNKDGVTVREVSLT